MTLYRWLRISFLNLLLVACLGILLRYKIAYSLPFIDQKNVLHSHSHFAFTGWVTQTMLVLLVYFLQQQQFSDVFKKYKYLLLLNLFSAYGMLVSFILQGYALFSISFSTLSIFTAFAFAYTYWKDLNRLPKAGITHHWFKAALVFNILSSLGAFSLAALMMLKLANQKLYLSSVYYFLHFQYNGWFFFAGMGLFFFVAKLSDDKLPKKIFWLFALSCVPAYFLSVLWAAIHPLVYWMVVLATLVQTTAWILFIKLLFKNIDGIKNKFSKSSHWLLALSGIACSIKITLQLFSVIPSLSKLAFGFRPIVIGYLHLVLLGVITLFLLGYVISLQIIKANRGTNMGISIFVGGIFLNELILMIQGVGAISNTMIPFLNEALMTAALVLFSGMLVLNISLNKKTNP
jgi:hypothetical protein